METYGKSDEVKKSETVTYPRVYRDVSNILMGYPRNSLDIHGSRCGQKFLRR